MEVDPEQMLAMAIRHHNKDWFDYITDNELVARTLTDDSYHSYLRVAETYNKYNYFIDLYNKSWTQGLGSIIETANRTLEQISEHSTSLQYLNPLYLKIIMFLAKKGHTFNNPEIIEKIAIWEKEEMCKIIEDDKKSKNSFIFTLLLNF